MFVFYETSKAIENNNNPYIGIVLVICIIVMIVGLIAGIIISHRDK